MRAGVERRAARVKARVVVEAILEVVWFAGGKLFFYRLKVGWRAVVKARRES